MSYGYDEAPAQAPPAKKERGCFFYGCIISLILLLVLAIAVGVGSYFIWRYFIDKAKEYTETTPMTMPAVAMPEPERKELHQRVEAFGDALEKNEATEPIVLTAEDLNALIDDNPDFKGKAHVSIDGSEVKAEISVPLRKLNIGELADRYLNGSATLRVALLNGVLDVRADSVTVKGKPLPPEFMNSLRGQNLAEKAMEDPEKRAALDKLERIEIKDGKIYLTPRKSGPDPKAEAKEPKAENEAPKPEADPKADAEPKPDAEPKAEAAPKPDAGDAPKGEEPKA